MKKIDFEHFKSYISINHKISKVIDARETFADMIYTNVNGIRAHSLAMKIFKSKDAEEYTPEEIKLIVAVAEKMCVPGFIDGLSEQLNCQTDKDE